MNNDFILNNIEKSAVSGARLDFSDLMERIQADAGRSTAPQMAKKGAPVRKIAAIAAGVVMVALLSVAVSAIGGGAMMSAESEPSYAPEAMEDVMCEPEYSITEDEEFFELSEPVYNETVDSSANNTEVSDGAVSDSDVSDSDISGSDADEGN